MEEFFERLNPFVAIDGLKSFLEVGGDVLFVIMVVTFAMWMLIIERYIYFTFFHKKKVQNVCHRWETIDDKKSWEAHVIRRMLLSQIRLESNRYIGYIETFVAIAPLLGLLGTVTGMVEVFDAMAFSSSGSARGMASGVSKATIPTMAGMVVALSGLFFASQLRRYSKFQVQKTSEKLVIG